MNGRVFQFSSLASRREALGLGAALTCCAGTANAQAPAGPRTMRPQIGDLLVRASGNSSVGDALRLSDIERDAQQILAWPKDPASETVRDGSRLNQILLIRLDPESLDAETRGRAAEGVVAYSATCTHSLCPVTEWLKDEGVLHCPCHASEFNPRAGAKVTGGPALRRLPPLALRLSADGGLQVAQPFLGRVGGPPT